MGSYPWGPHGPEASPYDVKPNPTPPSAPVPVFGQPDFAPVPMAGGGAMGGSAAGGSAAGGFLANIIFSFVVFLLVWEAAVCLYPLTAASAFVAAYVTAPMVNLVAPAELKGDMGYLMAVFAAIVAAAVVIRLENRMARNTAYRIGRHVVRMVLLGMWAIPILMLTMGASAPRSSTLFIISVVTSPEAMLRFLRVPMLFGIWFAFMLGLHFMIWNWGWARRFWHRRLTMIGLK